MDQIKIREIPLEQAALVNGLVTREFPYQGTHCYFDDFPVWGSEQAVRLGAFAGEALLSHAGYRLARMKTPTGPVPVALIGAVATDRAHRGKGLSTRLLNDALSRIDRSGAEWTLLWGSEKDFYARLGFQPAGRQCRAMIADLSISPKDLAHLTPVTGLNEEILQDLM
ncbi:MAG: GNAT family N-acetyltransferase, partial [Proteobacteria bacterium]|nr:GNAT family N-acetyltransferase [Pseudomonadota bacterium]